MLAVVVERPYTRGVSTHNQIPTLAGYLPWLRESIAKFSALFLHVELISVVL
jgi:hypothetical protein